jgi:hypothetical protein
MRAFALAKRVHRHPQHHVGRIATQVVALPDHVAQVVAHVLTGHEADDLGLQPQPGGQGPAELHVDPLAGVGIRREVVVTATFSRPRLWMASICSSAWAGR